VSHVEAASEKRAPSVLFLRQIVPLPDLLAHPRFVALGRLIWPTNYSDRELSGVLTSAAQARAQ